MTTVDPGGSSTSRTVAVPTTRRPRRYRLWAATGRGPAGPVTVVCRQQPRVGPRGVGALRRSLQVGVPLVLLMLAAGTWLVLGRALRRVDRIRAEVDAITRTTAGPAGPRVEVRRRGRQARGHDEPDARPPRTARSRQREFVADVSHDLQSPLATQRTQLEVARAHPESIDLDRLAATCWLPTTRWSTWSATCSSSPPPTPVRPRTTGGARPRGRGPRGGEPGPRPGDLDVDTTQVSAAPAYADRARSSGSCATCSRTRSRTPTPWSSSGVITRRGSSSTWSTTVRASRPRSETGLRPVPPWRPAGATHVRQRPGSAIARTIAERHGGTWCWCGQD